MKNTLKTSLGCLLAILVAGCEKNEAPQTTGATALAPLAAQTTGTSPAAGPPPSVALPSDLASQIKAMDAKLVASGCGAAFDSAEARGASEAELNEILFSKMCGNLE